MNTSLTARIDKSGKRVLCGRAGCGAQLAHIVTRPGIILSNMERGTQLSSGPETRHVQFGAGWKQDQDGLWALSNGARTGLERDRALAVGNSLTSPKLAAEARERLASGKAIANRRPVRNEYIAGRVNQARNIADLPAFARCHDCKGVNRLEAAVLSAVAPRGR